MGCLLWSVKQRHADISEDHECNKSETAIMQLKFSKILKMQNWEKLTNTTIFKIMKEKQHDAHKMKKIQILIFKSKII